MKIFLLNTFCIISYFVIWYFLIWLGCFIAEKKKPFIETYIIYKYNPYTFIRSILLQSVFDRVYYDPDTFSVTGIIIYEGLQGSGKTMSLVYDVKKLARLYPKVFLVDNLGICDAGCHQIPLEHWKQLLDINNGAKGVITVIDETQLWFSNKDSKNFDPSALGVICQNRKNRRVIFGTCQRFYLLAKDLRMQCTEVRSSFTIGNVITGYIRKQPILDQSGELKKVKFKGIRLFVQSNELRNSYDTLKVIRRLSSSGFNDIEKNYLKR